MMDPGFTGTIGRASCGPSPGLRSQEPSTQWAPSSPPAAAWDPSDLNIGGKPAPACQDSPAHRVSPGDNYSSNMELAIEALIRMKMSQLVFYQSVSGGSRLKQDIKDGELSARCC